jgi:hypothetical protein
VYLTALQAVKQGLSSITSFLLSLNPSLLYRENATGRTPLEMSREIYIASCVGEPPKISSGYGQYYPGRHDYSSIINQAASTFVVPKAPKPEETKKRTWEICASVDKEMLEEGGEGKRKRRLVSLFEANEVAKRVTGMKRNRGGRQLVINGGLIDGELKPDIVTKWM